MKDYLINDPIIHLLASKSSLSKNQFFAYLIRKKKINKKKIEKEQIFRTRGALGGAFFQAKNNIRKSVYTILLLFYLDIWGEKEEKIIISLIDGLKKIRTSKSNRKNDVALYVAEIIKNMI